MTGGIWDAMAHLNWALDVIQRNIRATQTMWDTFYSPAKY